MNGRGEYYTWGTNDQDLIKARVDRINEIIEILNINSYIPAEWWWGDFKEWIAKYPNHYYLNINLPAFKNIDD